MARASTTRGVDSAGCRALHLCATMLSVRWSDSPDVITGLHPCRKNRLLWCKVGVSCTCSRPDGAEKVRDWPVGKMSHTNQSFAPRSHTNQRDKMVKMDEGV